MDNVLNFPTKLVRDKTVIGKTIKELLSQTPIDQETTNKITERLLEIFEKYQCKFLLPLSIPFPVSISDKEKNEMLRSIEQGLATFEKSLHDHMNVLILERFDVEIKLYLATRIP